MDPKTQKRKNRKKYLKGPHSDAAQTLVELKNSEVDNNALQGSAFEAAHTLSDMERIHNEAEIIESNKKSRVGGSKKKQRKTKRRVNKNKK